jgi:hypothetical protein
LIVSAAIGAAAATGGVALTADSSSRTKSAIDAGRSAGRRAMAVEPVHTERHDDSEERRQTSHGSTVLARIAALPVGRGSRTHTHRSAG